MIRWWMSVCALSLIIGLPGTGNAAVPGSMNVQGRLTDDSGVPLPAGLKELTFSIYDAHSGGSQIWTEPSQFISSDADGLWNGTLGESTPLKSEVFADTSRWLEITVDDGINPSVTLPRVPLMSGPYSFTDGDWLYTDSIVYTAGYRGISRGMAGNSYSGDSSSTIVSLGAACTTGGFHSSIGGGFDNVASASFTHISGGNQNTASSTGATVGGGSSNSAGGGRSTIAGGFNNMTT